MVTAVLQTVPTAASKLQKALQSIMLNNLKQHQTSF
jgi:hypothetical protein